MSLAQRTIALAEGRQLEDLAQLLEKEGAVTLRCPLSIHDPQDDGPVLAWLHELIDDRFGWVVLFTGEGLRRLLTCAERHGLRDTVIAGLRRTKTLTRGPKPVRALKEISLAPTVVATSPTTEGVIAALGQQSLTGQTVGVQLYSDSNPPLMQFLQGVGATVRAVQPYVYAPAADAESVVDLLKQMAQGKVDVIVFTSSPQVDRLYEVTKQYNMQSTLTEGLEKTKVAAVGPLVADSLKRRGARVDICPETGFVMKNLVQHIKRFMGE